MLTNEQQANRSEGIGASEVAALWGLHPYVTAYKLWEIKTGRIQRDDLSDNEFVWWGHQMETPISTWYTQETGEELVEAQKTYYCPTEKRLLCHPDRIVLGKPKLIEIKTAQYNPDRWGESGSDQIPFEYILQCQAQMACAPAIESVDLVVMFRQVFKCQIYTIKRDNDLIKKIIKRVGDFWSVNVEGGIAPELQNLDDVKAYYKAPVEKASIEASQTVLSSLAILQDAKKLEKELKETKDTHQKIICEYIGDNELLMNGDRIIATWKANKNGRRTLSVKD